MSKALCSIQNETEKVKTIQRRLKSKTEGLGYWAAKDAIRASEQIARVLMRLEESKAL